jgi:MFS family permease
VWIVIFAVITNASGRSLQTPTLSALISHTSDPKQQGTVFGLFHMLGSLARVIGPIIAAGVYTKHHTSPYIVAGSITFVATIWTMMLRGAVARQRVPAVDGVPSSS